MRRQITAIVVCLLASVGVVRAQDTLTPTYVNEPDATTITTTDDGAYQVPLTLLRGSTLPFRLTGQIAEETLLLPVLGETLPTHFVATGYLTPDVETATLEVRSNARTLALYRIDEDTSLQPFRIEVPLEGAAVDGNVMPLTFQARLRSADDVCTTQLIGARLDLVNASLVYPDDVEPPTTVGQFFPAALSQLTLVVPEDPSLAEAEAALVVGTAAADLYEQPDIVMMAAGDDDALPEPDEAALFTRTIVIDEREDAMFVEDGVLTIGADVIDNATLLTQGILPAAISNRVRVQAVPDAEALRTARAAFTLADLGVDDLQVSGDGRLDIVVRFAQADVGGLLEAASTRLAGTYTPIVEAESATMSVLMNGTLLRALSLETGDSFDIDVDIPAETLQRDNTLIVRFHHIPEGGRCTLNGSSFTAQVFDRSVIRFERGESSLTGFERFPSSLTDNFIVGIEALQPQTLDAAVQVVTAMQRTTRRPLQPRVIAWDDAVASDLPKLLVGNADLNAPFRFGENVQIVGERAETVAQFAPDSEVAALQAFNTRGTDVLMLSGDTGQIERLGLQLHEDPLGWYGLQGDLLLLGPTSGPVNVNVRGNDNLIQPLADRSLTIWFQVGGFAAAVIVVLIILTLAYPRVVRRQPDDDSELTPEPEASS